MKLNEQYEATVLPMSEIFHDSTFNHRGYVAPMDVVELSRDIDKNGLRDPILVREYKEKEGFKYRIIAGHRRHMAFKVLKKTEIPCRIIPVTEELDDYKISFSENLQRKQLNILQEAHAIKIYKDKGYSARLVAEEFSQTVDWALVRFQLLELPAEIQEVAAAGLLTQQQIKNVHKLKTYEDQIELVKKIKISKEKGEAFKTPLKQDHKNILRSRIPTPQEISEMLEFLADSTGPGLHTRLLAWARGNISIAAVYQDIETYCKENQKPFSMPTHIRQALTGAKVTA